MTDSQLTQKGRRTRLRIIEATGEQILASGVGGTTLDAVRAATLTSKSQLFHYFPGGKAELLREVARWESEQLLEAQEPEIDDLGSWASWYRWREALVDYYLGRGRWACSIGSLVSQAATVDSQLDDLIRTIFVDWRLRLGTGVRRMQARGELTDSADPDRTAVAILASLQGGLLLSQSERSAWPLEAALDAALQPLHSAAS